MSTYREIIGKKVKKVSSDPSSGLDGEMWYNSTTGTLRGIKFLEAWVSSSKYITGRASFGSAGTQAANVIFGGRIPAMQNLTEEYNGSGWNSSGVIGSAGYAYRGFGTQTAAVSAGLFMSPGVQTTIYEYDGSTWTSANALPGGRACMGTAGTLTAGLAFSGSTGPFTNVSTSTFKYDGTNWTTGNALSTGRSYIGGFGTQTAAIGCGGYSGSPNNDTTTGATEEYDGTNWTAGGTMNTARRAFGTSGIQTAGLIFGGSDGSDKTATESYNGSSWTTSPATLATANRLGGGSPAGSSTAALNTEGGASPYGATTQEFNASTEAYTAAAWASGGAMTTARTGLASAGTQTANVFIGGQMSNSPNAPLNTVELYNGTTWSSNPNNAPYSASNNCGTGTQTAALSWGGYPNITTTLEFDGSSFTTTGALGTGRELTSNNIGVQTAAIAASGYVRSPDSYPTQTEEYNGSSWTGGPVVNTPRYSAAGAGTTAAALISGGIEPGQLSNAEEYNGSSWTSVTSRPYAGGNAGTSGTQTASLAYGGNPGGALTTTVSYDGTAWATNPSMAQARAMMGSSAGGTSTAALASSGAAPTATEEFTGQTTTVNITDFTTS